MSRGDNKRNRIQIVSKLPAEYFVIVNSPNKSHEHNDIDLDKTILLRMEPHMENNKELWGFWSDVSSIKDKLLYAGFHNDKVNNLTWHL